MNLLTRILSFVFPVTRKISTRYNGVVEITLINGRKVLDSKNTNYSYGSLQRVLFFGLSKTFSPGIHKILLLGLGGGSVIPTLRDSFHFKGYITAVEIDPVIIAIAKDEFGIVSDERLEIINNDAFDFVLQETGLYDLVIIDLFIDSAIPRKFYQPQFWNGVKSLLSPTGCILFNSLDEANSIDEIRKILAAENVEIRQYNNIENTNTIITARLK